jgi:serine/threonine protein kinase
MSALDFTRVRELFLAARKLHGAAREFYLDETCGDDKALRAEVESLLANLDDPSAQLIETPLLGSAGASALRAVVGVQEIPERIGQYRILRLIGEGAMGSVYEAEQDNPRRRVALKLLRPGLISSQVFKRFGLEAQILGRLHHPGIAQVYEAGAFGAAQPYFAMEFIDGPILARYLAEKNPGTRDKLRLIARLCDALQHAHDRGVIHRDLKPANIIVVDEEEPQPKILDFGVARLADPDLRITTLQTGIGQLIGTVAYMSPEQARGDTAALDARSDVYAIGVMAYEALAGRLPYELGGCALHESLRIIQESDPTPLSRVDRVFRGDLETIIAKALEKDPARRYSSAAALAADIRHFLSDEPIIARPATRLYHLSKFASRNRILVGGLAATLLALAAGTAISTTLYFRSEHARAGESAAKSDALRSAKKANAINDFILQRLLRSPNPGRDGRDVKVAEVLDKAGAGIEDSFPDDPGIQAELHAALATTYQSLSLYPASLAHRQRALELREKTLGQDHPDTLIAMVELGQGYMSLARDDDAESVLETARARLGTRESDSDPVTLDVLGTLADAYQHKGKYIPAESLLRRVIAARQPSGLSDGLLYNLNILAACLNASGRLQEAAAIQQQYYDAALKLKGSDHPSTLAGLNNLGGSLIRLHRPRDAEPLLKLALENDTRVLGPEHRETGLARLNLAMCYQLQRRNPEADAEYAAAIPIMRATSGDTYATEHALDLYAQFLSLSGQFPRADPIIRERLAIQHRTGNESDENHMETLGTHIYTLNRISGCKESLAEAQEALNLAQMLYPANDPRISRVQSWYGECLVCLKRYAEAEPLLIACYARQRDAGGLPQRDAILIADMLTQLYDRTGRSQEAHEWNEISEGRAR